MLKIIQNIWEWLRGETLKLLIFAGILLIIWGIIAPVGTLSWWLSTGTQALGLDINPTPDLIKNNHLAKPGNKNCYIIFLPGVGDFSANELTQGEEVFLNQLATLHPQCAIVDDVFPYSAANKSLGGQRFLAPVWRFASKEHGWLKNADVLIKIRNLWRFAISADNRYGSVYNLGIAKAIAERMNAASSINTASTQPIKIILIGTSGGAQVSLGAVEYLYKWLNTRLIVVSVGGSFDGETGFNQVEKVYHLRGSRDWVEDVTKIIFADRWSWMVNSPFIQAVRQKRYQIVETGSHTHDGKYGYFSTGKIDNTQTTYVGLLLEKVDWLPIWDD
ncbi:hypothetical protein Riv7116_4411 [Rivularia sp. PCC 7116]|uniref:hypothetical protein n=1 Tax=Rivularia sp. PCC 7116 TaxID=373994 RepID=UPI00029F44AC|nr:hypothetical protein [Rivularia sp. PCC 7116]AFY56832.1 hypothetical protein Riv7116_4411 [Rivularia sp. PCC 7116]